MTRTISPIVAFYGHTRSHGYRVLALTSSSPPQLPARLPEGLAYRVPAGGSTVGYGGYPTRYRCDRIALDPATETEWTRISCLFGLDQSSAGWRNVYFVHSYLLPIDDAEKLDWETARAFTLPFAGEFPSDARDPVPLGPCTLVVPSADWGDKLPAPDRVLDAYGARYVLRLVDALVSPGSPMPICGRVADAPSIPAWSLLWVLQLLLPRAWRRWLSCSANDPSTNPDDRFDLILLTPAGRAPEVPGLFLTIFEDGADWQPSHPYTQELSRILGEKPDRAAIDKAIALRRHFDQFNPRREADSLRDAVAWIAEVGGELRPRDLAQAARKMLRACEARSAAATAAGAMAPESAVAGALEPAWEQSVVPAPLRRSAVDLVELLEVWGEAVQAGRDGRRIDGFVGATTWLVEQCWREEASLSLIAGMLGRLRRSPSLAQPRPAPETFRLVPDIIARWRDQPRAWFDREHLTEPALATVGELAKAVLVETSDVDTGWTLVDSVLDWQERQPTPIGAALAVVEGIGLSSDAIVRRYRGVMSPALLSAWLLAAQAAQGDLATLELLRSWDTTAILHFVEAACADLRQGWNEHARPRLEQALSRALVACETQAPVGQAKVAWAAAFELPPTRSAFRRQLAFLQSLQNVIPQRRDWIGAWLAALAPITDQRSRRNDSAGSGRLPPAIHFLESVWQRGLAVASTWSDLEATEAAWLLEACPASGSGDTLFENIVDRVGGLLPGAGLRFERRRSLPEMLPWSVDADLPLTAVLRAIEGSRARAGRVHERILRPLARGLVQPSELRQFVLESCRSLAINPGLCDVLTRF